MPTEYIHFTEEQKQQARQTDLVALLQSQGEHLKRSGKEYVWRDGSDKVTVRGNLWFHQYERIGGDAVDFVRRFYHMDFPQAVGFLLGNNGGTLQRAEPIRREPPKPFALPPKNENMRRVFAYLLNRRGIDRDVLYGFVHKGMIYESADYHNAVFVGCDESGTPRHAHKRGTGSESSYKGNTESSDPRYSFHWTGRDNTLYLFEAPIDIYDRFLAGDSLKGIAKLLEEKGIKSPTGKAEWQFSTIQSILSNERYKGDAIINKTYITDCISKKVRVNNGERPKYYVENSHPAIIDSATFGRVQEELARRSGKRKISRKAKTEQGKYSSKYALTELLVCGECKSAYRRCTWTASGKKKIVWRCINRIEYAKKYCHNSPSVEESVLQRAVMAAIMETANQNAEVLRTLKLHIGMGLAGEKSEDNSIDLQIRIAEIDAEFKKMLDRVSTDTIEAFDEETATRLMNEKSRLQQQLDSIADAEQRRENAKSRLDDIYTILDGIKNRPMEYDDQIVRQLLECIVVDSKEQITVIFKGGLKSVQPLTE